MKKAMALLLASLLLAFTACGEGAVGDGASDKETSIADYGLGQIVAAAGVECSGLYSSLDDADRTALSDYAATLGISVRFEADGSTVFAYADGQRIIQHSDGTVTFGTGEESDTAAVENEWPENEYTALMPKPDFEVETVALINGGFTVTFNGVTVDAMRDYGARVKAAGFDVAAEELDMAEAEYYSYAASNAAGDSVSLEVMGDAATLTVILK